MNADRTKKTQKKTNNNKKWRYRRNLEKYFAHSLYILSSLFFPKERKVQWQKVEYLANFLRRRKAKFLAEK